MGTPSFCKPYVTIAHHQSFVWGRTNESTQTQRKSGLSGRPCVFLSPFVVIWRLFLMHWHRHKWHHQQSSDNKHGFPKHFPAMKQLCFMSRPHAEMFPPCRSQRQSGAGDASLSYWVALSGLSAAVTAPAVIEFGLFSLQNLTPDFIEENGIWKVGDTGRQTLFLYIRWCTELELLMWEMPACPCSLVLLLLPFLSPPEDTMLWMSESLSGLL